MLILFLSPRRGVVNCGVVVLDKRLLAVFMWNTILFIRKVSFVSLSVNRRPLILDSCRRWAGKTLGFGIVLYWFAAFLDLGTGAVGCSEGILCFGPLFKLVPKSAATVSSGSEKVAVLMSEGAASMDAVALSMAASRISSFVDPGMLNLEGCQDTASVAIVLLVVGCQILMHW